MRNSTLIFLFIGFLVGCQSQTDAPAYGLINAADLKTLHEQNENLILLDVRTPAEVAEGSIEGAQNIDIGSADFEQKLKSLNKDGEYAVYCRIGVRSARAVQKMKELGFSKVYDLQGGYLAWQNEFKK